jgi:hypothetical protein
MWNFARQTKQLWWIYLLHVVFQLNLWWGEINVRKLLNIFLCYEYYESFPWYIFISCITTLQIWLSSYFAINMLHYFSILWYVAATLGRQFLTLQSNLLKGLEPLKMKVTPSFALSGITYKLMQCHVQEDLNSHSDHCENIKTCIIIVAVLYSH